MFEVVFTMLWLCPFTSTPVRLMPDAKVRDANDPKAELSKVRVFSFPSAATAASKLVAAATDLGAVAKEPAPASAPV
jgi:hypothetical protein